MMGQGKLERLADQRKAELDHAVEAGIAVGKGEGGGDAVPGILAVEVDDVLEAVVRKGNGLPAVEVGRKQGERGDHRLPDGALDREAGLIPGRVAFAHAVEKALDSPLYGNPGHVPAAQAVDVLDVDAAAEDVGLVLLVEKEIAAVYQRGLRGDVLVVVEQVAG